MKISLFLLCLFISTMMVDSLEDVGDDDTEDSLPEDSLTEDNLTEDSDPEDYESSDADTSAADVVEEVADAAAGTARPFQYKPSQRLKELSEALPVDKKRPMASGKVKKTMTDAVAGAMSTPAAKQGLADLDHEWRLLVAGPEAARVIGTTSGNAKRVLTSPIGAEFLTTALATTHALLSKAGEESRGSGLGRVLSTAFFLFASPAMPDVVNEAGGLLLTAVLKPNAALFVRRFWDDVRVSLKDGRLVEKMNKCSNNVMSLMRTFHNSGPAGRQTPAVKAGAARK